MIIFPANMPSIPKTATILITCRIHISMTALNLGIEFSPMFLINL